MIDWCVEISSYAPSSFKTEKYLNTVRDTVKPCMDHLCKRLLEMNDWDIKMANSTFMKIIDEIPILTLIVREDGFQLRYNKYVDIKITDGATKIYREIKLDKILN